MNVRAAISRARAYEDPQFPLAARLPLLVRDLDGRAGGDGFESLGGAARERIRRHAPERADRAVAPRGFDQSALSHRPGRLP